MRTCKGRSQISRTAEPIALKFGTAMGGSESEPTLHVRTTRAQPLARSFVAPNGVLLVGKHDRESTWVYFFLYGILS